jgi:hypothetical protein
MSTVHLWRYVDLRELEFHDQIVEFVEAYCISCRNGDAEEFILSQCIGKVDFCLRRGEIYLLMKRARQAGGI